MHYTVQFKPCIYYYFVLSAEKEARKVSIFYAIGVQDGHGDSAYQSGDRLVYLKPLANPGGHYNTTTGEYSCEMSGMYYFSYSIYGYHIEDGPGHSRAGARLIKEGVNQGALYVSNGNSEQISITLTQSLILQCNAGEKVWVESGNNNSYIVGFSHLNVFTGVLLFML